MSDSEQITAAVLVIGDEILSGKRQDKHLAKVIELLSARGLALSWARYVGDNRYALVTGPVFIPAYATLDVHLAWRPVRGVELSLVGQNLLQQRHLETISDQSAAQHEMERSVYGKVAWAF